MAKVAVRRSGNVTLPQNLLDSAGTVVEDFAAVADWTLVQGTGIAEDATHVYSGSTALAVSCSNTTTLADKTINLDLSATYGTMRLHVYVDPASTGTMNAALLLGSQADFSKYAQVNLPTLRAGWNTLNILATDWTLGGGEAWANPMVKMRVRMQGSGTAVYTFDALTAGVEARGAVCVTFDDAYDSVHDVAFPYMAAHGVRGTVYQITGWIGDPTFMTSTMLHTLAAAGWTVGHHTENNWDMSVANGHDQAAMETELAAAIATLTGLGLGANAGHMSYPHGIYDGATLAAQAATAGMLTARTTSTDINSVMPMPTGGYFRMPGVREVTDATPEQVAGWLATAAARKEIIFLLMHRVDGPLPDFCKNAIDAIVASGLPALTLADIQTLRSGPCTVRLPY